MTKLNVASKSRIKNHEGGKAAMINPEFQLRRSVAACLLWEKSFYEEGADIAERIVQLVHENDFDFVAKLAIEARTAMKLRHVPLLLVRELARHKSKGKVAPVLEAVIQRADELSEFLAIYWKDGRCPLSGQVKKGLARAFNKFSDYDLAKYNRDSAIKLKDVLFLCHAKPRDEQQALFWKMLIAGKLQSPDTWEVALSAGKDKKETWERLLSEGKLGALALLRNLRNMKEVGVTPSIIFDALNKMKVDRVLPYRFIAAARYAPQWEDKIEPVMMKCIEGQEKMAGKTIILIDVSGSMNVTRIDAACGLAILAREICQEVEIYTFSNQTVGVPPRRGFALRDAIDKSQQHSSTYLRAAMVEMNKLEQDRIIVITDEQSQDGNIDPIKKGYLINVAAYKNGVGYGKWTHLDGFSESLIGFIREFERAELQK